MTSSNVTTPIPLYPAVSQGMRNDEERGNIADFQYMDVGYNTNGIIEGENLNLDFDALDALVEQGQADHDLYHQLQVGSNQTMPEPFNFSDFIY